MLKVSTSGDTIEAVKLIVGLGNPGDKYTNTRHNLGFEILEHFCRKINAPEFSFNKKFNAEISQVTINGEQLVLVRPQTFMNNSGTAVSAVKNFFKLDPANVIIVYDELDLPLGQIKIRLGGAAAGHHGVESIIESLGTDQFVRVRAGIGSLRTESSEHHKDHKVAEKYVVEDFHSDERSKVKHLVKHASGALELLLTEGLDKAQNQFN